MIQIDTQEQAHDFVDKVQLAAQKTKSIISEIAGNDKVMLEVVADLNPGLFPQEGRLDIIDMTTHYQAKAELNRIDILNLMVFAERIGPAFLVEAAWYHIDWPDSPMAWFVTSKLPIM